MHFTKHYLPSLQIRGKWQRERDQLQPGIIVMIVDPQLPRALWPVGKIINVFPSADGRIRTAEVRIMDRTYVRPVACLIKLPALPDMDTVSSPSE